MASPTSANTVDIAKKALNKISDQETDQHFTLSLPPYYNGSDMFMPNGERLYWQAEVTPYGPETFQDYKEIKSFCLSKGVLFEDPVFPADDSSLYDDEIQKDEMNLGSEPIMWLRPTELVQNPQFYVDGISRSDVNQGKLGDCWMAAALATLTLHSKLFNQVVPSDQSFEKDYTGMFHYRFWHFGRWVDVVIDDRLPTKQGKLIFLKSKLNNEFWSALLEKAYAKLYGSYKAIVHGLVAEALEDFSGGLLEIYSTSSMTDRFSHLHKKYLSNSLLAADLLKEKKKPRGLLNPHSYSITCVKYLDSETPLVRLRNPWGFREWRGPWSDNSAKWEQITDDKKEALGLTIENDGEFWMSYQDFIRYFTLVTICNLYPNYLGESTDDSTKEVMSIFEDEWVEGKTAGGSDQFPDSHWRNPQYIIELTDLDDAKNECIVILILTQKYGRSRCGKITHDIGIRVYRIDDIEPQGPLDKDFFCENQAINFTTEYLALRGYTFKLKLKPGGYVIVPSTKKPDEEGEFLMRVLTEKPHKINKLCAMDHQNNENDNDIDDEECDNDI